MPSKNRNPIKQVFITFPQSGEVSKQDFLTTLLRFEPDYYKIGQEKHKDGQPHLHCVVRFKNKFSIPFMIKYFSEVYPNDYKRIDFQPIRSIKHAINYTEKEDTNPLCSGEFTDNRNPSTAKYNKHARDFGYTDYKDFIETYPKEKLALKTSMNQICEKYFYIEKYYPDQIPQISFKTFNKVQKYLRDPYFIISKDDITFIKKELSIS